MSDIEIFLKKNESLKNKFASLEKDNIKNRIKELEKIIDENNTEPAFILEFLKLNSQIQHYNLKSYLEKYESCIFKDKFNELFGSIIRKKSAFDKFIELFNDLKSIVTENDNDALLVKIVKLVNRENDKYVQNFPIFYSINKELYFNSLLYHLVKNIKKTYSTFSKEVNKDELDEKRKKYVERLNNLKNSSKKPEDKKKIEDIEFIINNIEVCCVNDFLNYINRLADFISSIYDSFILRFRDNPIFKNENYDKGQENDILLFTDFIFFCMYFNFIEQSYSAHYLGIWKDSFNHIPYEKINFIDSENGKIICEKKGDNLLVQFKSKEPAFYIDNIEDYSIKGLIDKIKSFGMKLNIFRENKYLRMDKFNSKIYIKKNWELWRNYVIDILSSKAIKTAFCSTFPSMKRFDFYDKKELKNILDNIKFFSNKTKFCGLTKKKFLSIYMQSFPFKTTNTNKMKLNYLGIFVVTCIHEIIGHLFLRIHNYLYKDNILKSPPPKNMSSYTSSRGKESGEYLEELLFGVNRKEINTLQILYILDKNNYNVDFNDFRTKFSLLKKEGNAEIAQISEDLKKLFSLYEINFDEIKRKPDIYKVSKNVNEDDIYSVSLDNMCRIDDDDDGDD